MNAPQSAAVLEKPTLQLLAVSSLVPSLSHVQEVRRSRFVPKELQELADDIKRNGMMHQPIVRPLAGGKHEIVTGEQRWLAAKLLGTKEVFVNVRELTDDQALEMQLSENLRRKGLHEIEEAEGYDELMKLKKITVEELQDVVGQKKGYIYARLKLLALCKEARTAFYAGEIDASTALLIARIPHHDLQRQAMKSLAEEREYGEVKNFKEASAFLRDNFMLRLKEAPFDLKDETLLPKAGSCQKCPKRTGNQVDLFADVKESDICTDTKCFDEKRAAHYAVAVRRIEVSGKKVIHGDAAKKILPHWKDNSSANFSSGYRALDEYDMNAGGKLRAALPKDFEPVLVQHPGTGKIIEAATSQQLTKAKLKSKHGGSTGGSYDYAAAERRHKAKGPDVDEMLTDRLAELIHKNAPKAFGKAWLLDLAKEFYDKLSLRDEDAVAKAWAWPTSAFTTKSYQRSTKLPVQVAKLDERGIVLFMFHLIFAVGPYTRDGVLKLFEINEDKTRELIIEERKAAAKKAREEAKAKKEAQAKGTSAVAKVNAAIEKRVAKAKSKKK